MDSIKTELSQSNNVYPSFSKVTKDEGFDDVAHAFDLVATVENCHHLLLQQIYDKFYNV